jgi:hypothetical protein
MTNVNTPYAVLTGDIVKSSATPPEALHRLFREMKATVRDFAKARPQSVVGGLVVVQGDRWQVLLRRACLAERLMACMAAVARKQGRTTRIALGIGAVDRLDSKNISESTGEAFTLSGHALDELERLVYKKQYWRIEGANITPHRKILTAILGQIASSWTQGQAEAILFVLQGLTTAQALVNLDIKQPAFAKRLAAAMWAFFETTIREAESPQG